MRKSGKKPSNKQKDKLKALGLNHEQWLIVRDRPGCFEIVHRISTERRKLGA